MILSLYIDVVFVFKVYTKTLWPWNGLFSTNRHHRLLVIRQPLAGKFDCEHMFLFYQLIHVCSTYLAFSPSPHIALLHLQICVEKHLRLGLTGEEIYLNN